MGGKLKERVFLYIERVEGNCLNADIYQYDDDSEACKEVLNDILAAMLIEENAETILSLIDEENINEIKKVLREKGIEVKEIVLAIQDKTRDVVYVITKGEIR